MLLSDLLMGAFQEHYDIDNYKESFQKQIESSGARQSVRYMISSDTGVFGHLVIYVDLRKNWAIAVVVPLVGQLRDIIPYFSITIKTESGFSVAIENDKPWLASKLFSENVKNFQRELLRLGKERVLIAPKKLDQPALAELVEEIAQRVDSIFEKQGWAHRVRVSR